MKVDRAVFLSLHQNYRQLIYRPDQLILPPAELNYRQAQTIADCQRAFSLMIDPTGTHDYAAQYDHHQNSRTVNQPGGEKFWIVEQVEPGSRQLPLVAMQLSQFQADRSVTIWPPVLRTDLMNPAPVRKKLMQIAILEARLAGCQMLQSFTEREDFADRQLLEENGLPYISDLIVMQRPVFQLRENDPVYQTNTAAKIPLQIEAIEADYDVDELACLIEQTYAESMDFPELIGRKSGHQSVRTHQQQGIYNPAFWYWIVTDQQRVGVLLLTQHHDPQTWELIYLGIIPEFRRRGLSRYALKQVLSNEEIQKQGIRVGVDIRNIAATRLYESLGFVPQTRQCIHFCWLDEQTNH